MTASPLGLSLSLCLAVCVVGCAPTMVTAAPATPVAADTPPLPPATAERYQIEHFELRPVGTRQEPTLVRANVPVAEADFRNAYRRLLHTNELDALALARARHENVKVLATASGVSLLGVGAIALAATPDGGCTRTEANCGRGIMAAGLLAAAGLVTLLCEAHKGVKCLVDGPISRSWLKPDELTLSVDRYNRALVQSLSM